MSLRLNPVYEKLLPRMSEEEFAQLKASIKTEGQHYPIIVNEDLEVLDGHHRFRACIELGIEPDFEVRKFDDKLLEKKFVIEANLRRRHLNNFQLVELAVPLLEIEKALAKQRQSKGGKNGRDLQLGLASDDTESNEPQISAKATEVVAKKAGLSTRTFERGKKILDNATEDDKQRLREGKVSISKVYQEIREAEKPKPTEPEVKVESEGELQNKLALLALLERLLKAELFCPSCGNSMLECSKCHKTLKALLQSLKTEK
ncbi:MAG TPA: ParB N-terminal domain-containing protein [Candidatus Deferrimicrobiaceae bacterium]|nr:ParB N-terminal domain-containing protein [Candidatus Deferrimicrobiaceae bacterium]